MQRETFVALRCDWFHVVAGDDVSFLCLELSAFLRRKIICQEHYDGVGGALLNSGWIEVEDSPQD